MWNEEMIINLFFQKHKKERLLWELSTNKREEALKSLHDLKYVKKEIMHSIPYYTEKYLEKELKKFGNFTNVYYMGLSYTGMLPLKKAIERSREEDEGCIIYCGEGIGYCHTDHEEGAPLAYLLKVKNYREIEKNYDCTFGTEGIEEWMLHE